MPGAPDRRQALPEVDGLHLLPRAEHRDGAAALLRAPPGRAGLRAGEQPHRAEIGAPGDRVGTRDRGQVVRRPPPGPRRPRARRGRAAAPRGAPAEGGADLPARRRRGARLRAGPRRDRRGRGEARLPRGAGQGSARRARAGVRVLGKADETGAPLFPIQGGMDSDAVAERLGPRLLRLAERQPDLAARIRRRLDAIRAIRARPYEAHPGRTPNYCSGCPHNVGTRLLPGRGGVGQPRAATPSPRSSSSPSGTSSR